MLCFSSDLTVELDGKTIKAHRFVLAARSDHWGVKDLSDATSVDMKGEVFLNLIKSCKVAVSTSLTVLLPIKYTFLFPEFPQDVAYMLLKWVYTDTVHIASQSDSFLLDLLKAASMYQLRPLADRCEL
jgi:hypothetical protein